MLQSIKGQKIYKIYISYLLSNGKINTHKTEFDFSDIYGDEYFDREYSIWEINEFYCGVNDNHFTNVLCEKIEYEKKLGVDIYVSEIFDIRILELI